jgi:uncharacterized protein YbcV (DUF1398 family)
MFTLEQISEIHDRFGDSDTLGKYLHALKAVGVDRYDTFIADGHKDYYGQNGQKLVAPPTSEKLTVSDTSDQKGLMHTLKLVEQDKLTYIGMLKALADNGIEKWTFDTNKMTITYSDKSDQALLVEKIE